MLASGGGLMVARAMLYRHARMVLEFAVGGSDGLSGGDLGRKFRSSLREVELYYKDTARTGTYVHTTR